ncbi:MAG: hypothetical protein IKQ47_05270 [Prevotella sp.]|nr:hypothetical protein [Prevotella sp.]
MDNKKFLKVISNSFERFLECGTSRSTKKLKPLHGAIAMDIAERLGSDYEVVSQGWADDCEATIGGRYVDKKVDITVLRNGKSVGGIAVKFVMQNYSQNSNNYFENMLGETANIRSNMIPYFQIFIILDKLPYYDKSKNIKRWEEFTDHNAEKYTVLSQDHIETFLHTPNKTLIYVIHIPDNESLKTADEYMDFYRNHQFEIKLSNHKYNTFGETVILNDYEEFIRKVYHTIMSL